MKYLIDTNVISELVARQPDPRVVAWIAGTDESLLHLSVITIGEIEKGIAKLPDSERKTRLAAWLSVDLLERFAGRIMTLDTEVLLCWGELSARLEQARQPLPAMDGLIAASALAGDFVLVTRNSRDFVHTGGKLLNPWET